MHSGNPLRGPVGRLDVRKVDFDGHASLDHFQLEHHPNPILLAIQHSYHVGEGAGCDAHPLADFQAGMRLISVIVPLQIPAPTRAEQLVHALPNRG
jgi:hypothetical protein